MPQLYELTITQEYFGQVALNRWNFFTDSTPAGGTLPQLLVEAFGALPENGVYPGDTPFDYMRAVQSEEVRYVSIECFDVYDPTAFYNTPFEAGLNGIVAGNPYSPTQAFGFRSSRSRRDIRRGFKRFVGVTGGSVQAGGVIDTGVLDKLQDLGTAMSGALSIDDDGNTVVFQPCVVAKEKYTPTGKNTTAYRYYADSATQFQNIATSIVWEPYTQVRTQNSRQYGRGI